MQLFLETTMRRGRPTVATDISSGVEHIPERTINEAAVEAN
jgi:hypothetical protein